MNFRIDWIDGAPEKLEPGMMVYVQFEDEAFQYLIGEALHNGATEGDDCYAFSMTDIARWGWLVQPHELEWIADMAQRHGKGRPEQ